MLTKQELRRILHYDPNTGIFTWRDTSKFNRNKEKQAGCVNCHGYIVLEIAGKEYQASKLAWLYVYGTYPTKIDHIDNNRANNAINNLREATFEENNWNRRKASNNTSGIKGLSINVSNKNAKPRWAASVTANGKRSTKYFKIEEKEMAIEWLKTTRENLHKEFDNHG